MGPKADGERWFWCVAVLMIVFDAVYSSVIMVVKKCFLERVQRNFQ